ncbi:MAG: ABC transporter ATP-binding protein [Planctomycetes bacterium]|nr:ABC transporter ATP-binding protein [Planctomycetota bacterium]
MSDVAIQVDDLHHSFKKHQALCGVTFSVPARSIHGFVGPNGAGKTTTLKVLATLLKPDRGSARIFGEDVARMAKQVRRRIGFMPDHFSMYRQMTVFEYLDFFAAAYGMRLAQRDKVITDVLGLTDMGGRRNDLIKGLSRGMQQRVSLARVLVHDPDLLLLDEPASGLDPRARIELMDILQELKRMGKTVFISSHILSELGDLCDSVTILDRGTVQYSGAMADLLKSGGGDGQAAYVLVLPAADEALRAALAELPGVTRVAAEPETPNRYVIAFDPARVTTSTLLSAALARGANVVEFREDRRHLNQAFMDLTKAGVRS